MLELFPRVRAGGRGISRREYLDFVVDGRSLQDALREPDLIGCLGWWVPQAEAEHRQRLTGVAAPDSATGRVSLYVCPECGDLACGAVTARITCPPGEIVWSDFCFEGQYEIDPAPIPDVGPYRFDEAQYRQALADHPIRA